MTTKLIRLFGLLVSTMVLCTTALPVHAQNTDQTVSNLGDVVLRFCNENGQGEVGKMKTLFFEAETSESNDLCIYINNSGPTDVDVILNFVDGTVADNDDGTQGKACQPEGTRSNFGQYVDYISEVITVPAGSTVETHGEVKFPDGFAGLSYGCVTMKFADEEDATDEQKMINVLTRRGYFIDVLVGGDINLGLDLVNPPIQFENIGESDQFYVYKTDTGEHRAAITVENPGNIPQEVTVLPTMQALFAKPVQGKNVIEQSIVNDSIVNKPMLDWSANNPQAQPMTKKVLPKQQVTFDFLLNEGLPLWKGPIDISATITHKPIFEFVSADVFADLDKEESRTISTSFFVMPWLVIGLLLALLLLGVLATGKKKPSKHEAKKKTRTTRKTTTRKAPAKKPRKKTTKTEK